MPSASGNRNLFFLSPLVRKRCRHWTVMASCHMEEREEVEWVELYCASRPLHCYFWSNKTLLFQSQAGAKCTRCVINPLGEGERGGGLPCARRCAQNGINVTLGTRVSLPWWITEGITIMEIVIDWSFVSIYCSSVPAWPRRLKCYHVNSGG